MSEWKELVAKSTNEEIDKMLVEFKYLNNYTLWALYDELESRNYKIEKREELNKERLFRSKVLELTRNNKENLEFTFKKSLTLNFTTKLDGKLINFCIIRAMYLLYWEIVYNSDESIEAMKANSMGTFTEKIEIKINNSKIQVTSKHIDSSSELKRLSKRINEFKIAFQEIEQDLINDNEIITEIDKTEQIEKQHEYVVPEKLSKPKESVEKKIAFLFGGGIAVSLILGGLLAIFASFIYIIFLYDSGIGFLTAIIIGLIIKKSGISDLNTLKWIGWGSIGLTYFMSNIYRFLYLAKVNNIQDPKLLDYFMFRLETGLQYKNINLGEIGLIIAWIVELIVAGIFYYIKITQKIIKHDLENAPEDVVEYAIYLFNQEKNEDEVRQELKNKGWFKREQQDLIFKAIGAEMARQDIIRGE